MAGSVRGMDFAYRFSRDPMNENNLRERKRRAGGLSAFQKLEAQAKRLESSIFFLIALIALFPPLVIALTEIRHLRGRAAVHADHVATIIDLYGRRPDASPEGLRRHLQSELERDDLRSVRVLTVDGAVALALGDTASDWFPPDTVELALPARTAPFARVQVRPSDQALGRDLARIVAVHLLVGLVLGLGIYRVPVQAFGRAIEQLKTAQAQLVHADRLSALGSMYAGLTHEINNPLGILSARVKLALAAARETGRDAETVADLEVIDRQGARIAEIMRGLLAFARKAELTKRPVEVNAVVREVVALVEKPFAKQGVRVKTELDATLPPVQASPDHLQQVFLNLMTNARDAMPAGGTITLRTAREDGHVLAEVRDTGPGLAPRAQEHLFEPFFTTKEVGKGTGLGLSVSYGIVSAHGGELDGWNAPQGGAVFRITLPLLGGEGSR